MIRLQGNVVASQGYLVSTRQKSCGQKEGSSDDRNSVTNEAKRRPFLFPTMVIKCVFCGAHGDLNSVIILYSGHLVKYAKGRN